MKTPAEPGATTVMGTRTLDFELTKPDYATNPPPRMVVCSACRTEAGSVAVGARHFDQYIRAQVKAYGTRGEWFRAEQGFIDQRGVFLTRTEAWKVAEAAGQIRRRCGGDTANGGTLFSENLY